MHQDHGCSGRAHRVAKHLSRMNQAGIQQATRNGHRLTFQAILGIKMKYPELLLIDRAHMIAKNTCRIPWSAYRRASGYRFASKTSPNLKCRFKNLGFNRTNTFNRRQLFNRSAGQSSQRSVPPHQTMCEIHDIHPANPGSKQHRNQHRIRYMLDSTALDLLPRPHALGQVFDAPRTRFNLVACIP